MAAVRPLPSDKEHASYRNPVGASEIRISAPTQGLGGALPVPSNALPKTSSRSTVAASDGSVATPTAFDNS